MKIFQVITRIILFFGFCLGIGYGITKDASLTKTIIEIIAIIFAAIIAFFIFLDFSPRIALRIIPTWVDKKEGRLKIRTEIENVSKVVCWKKRIRFQILEQELNEKMINEIVAFDESYIGKMNPMPVNFKVAEEINESTLYVYPKEIIATERLYKVNPKLIQHIGLQFEAELGIMKYILWLFNSSVERWTTTIIITKDNDTETNIEKPRV